MSRLRLLPVAIAFAGLTSVAGPAFAQGQPAAAPPLPPPQPSAAQRDAGAGEATAPATPPPEAAPLPPPSPPPFAGEGPPARRRRGRPRPADPPPASTESSGVMGAPAAPPAPPASPPDDGDRAEAPAGPPDAKGIRVSLGARIAYIPTSGFDLYASNDALAGFSLDAVDAFWSKGSLALGAGVGWDVAGRSSGARGVDTSLVAHRFTVPLEARFAVTRFFWIVGRLAPGAAYARAEVKDGSSPADLVDDNWGFALDASVGPALVLGGSRAGTKRTPRFIVMPELGFQYTTPMALNPSPSRDREDVIGSDARTRLGDVALTGVFWRLTAGMVF